MFKLRVPWIIQHRVFLMKVAFIKWYTDKALRKILKTPPVESDNESNIEIHSLVDHDYLIYYLVAIKSLCFFSKKKFSVYCHCCKRNMTPDDVDILKKHIIGVNYINRDIADKRMRHDLAPYTLCDKYRNNCEEIIGTSVKLFDQLLISKTRKIMLLDADTMFFKFPAELVTWMESSGQESLYLKDKVNWYCIPYPDINKVEGLPRVPELFNAGLLCFDKTPLTNNLNKIEEAMKIMESNGGNFSALDQTIYALFLPNKRLLPETYNCEVRKPIKDNKDVIFKHYIGRDVRFGNLIYCREGEWVINQLLGEPERK